MSYINDKNIRERAIKINNAWAEVAKTVSFGGVMAD
jgi:hypothetical protein